MSCCHCLGYCEVWLSAFMTWNPGENHLKPISILKKVVFFCETWNNKPQVSTIMIRWCESPIQYKCLGFHIYLCILQAVVYFVCFSTWQENMLLLHVCGCSFDRLCVSVFSKTLRMLGDKQQKAHEETERRGHVWSSTTVPKIKVCGVTAAACPEAGGLCYMSVTGGGNGLRSFLVAEATSHKVESM